MAHSTGSTDLDTRKKLWPEHIKSEHLGPDYVLDEFARFLVGPLIGQGLSRSVYEWKPDDSLVLKVANNDKLFQNIVEYRFWTDYQGTALERWLAPCRLISDSGRFLLQAKCKELAPSRWPKRIPAALKCDSHSGNIMSYNGRAVFCDYGYAEVDFGQGGQRMRMTQPLGDD